MNFGSGRPMPFSHAPIAPATWRTGARRPICSRELLELLRQIEQKAEPA